MSPSHPPDGDGMPLDIMLLPVDLLSPGAVWVPVKDQKVSRLFAYLSK